MKLQVFLDMADKSAVPMPASKNTLAWSSLEGPALNTIFDGSAKAKDALTKLAADQDAVLAKEK